MWESVFSVLRAFATMWESVFSVSGAFATLWQGIFYPAGSFPTMWQGIFEVKIACHKHFSAFFSSGRLPQVFFCLFSFGRLPQKKRVPFFSRISKVGC
jgi:hypothetical protein